MCRPIRSNRPFFYSDDEASNALPCSPSPTPSNPFDDLDEWTRDLIRTLLREKDEARENYAEETIKTGHLEISLEVAQAGQAATENAMEAVRAQLITSDGRIAGDFLSSIEKPSSLT